MNSIPKSRVVVGFHDFFANEPLPDRLSLIRAIGKKNLIGEISGLNYRLKPKDRTLNDYSVQSQDRELFYLCAGDQNMYKQYGDLARQFMRGPNDHPLLFTRQTCLFALEELLPSDIPDEGDWRQVGARDAFLKYLLAVNTVVADIRKDNREETTDDIASDVVLVANDQPLSFEDINARIIAFNELVTGSDQIFIPYRALSFLQFMTTHPDFGKFAKNLIQEGFGGDYRQFIFDLLSIYVANNPDGGNNIVDANTGLPIDTSFIYYPKASTIHLFKSLSGIISNNDPEKLLSVRKFPFYDAGNDTFYLMDNTFLIEKLYSQFINDLWFDVVKNEVNEQSKPIYKVSFYRSAIGDFFEQYVNGRFRYMFETVKHAKLRTFNELLYIEKKQQKEFTDVYLRYNNRVFLGEAKSTGIYDKEKYSGDLDQFYRAGREAFFNAFGLEQIVNAVKKLKELAGIFDNGFPRKGQLRIYPALIVNEKTLQTPLMAQVFNNRFQEMVADMDKTGIKLSPLTILHISDLETMQGEIRKDHKIFWKLLDKHASNSVFMPPFYHTLNLGKVKADYDLPKIAIHELITEFGANKSQTV